MYHLTDQFRLQIKFKEIQHKFSGNSKITCFWFFLYLLSPNLSILQSSLKKLLLERRVLDGKTYHFNERSLVQRKLNIKKPIFKRNF